MEGSDDIRSLHDDLEAMDETKRKKEEEFPQALFVLYGESNKGKTTTLTELVFKLVKDPAIIGQIKNYVIDKKTKKYKNGCYIILYNGKWIFLSTWGDDRKSSELNINFFYNILINKDVYIIENNTFRKKARYEDYKQYIPNVCITASRIKGPSLPPTLYLSNKQLKPCKWQIWRHKMGDLRGYQNEDGIYVTNEDDDVANELKDMIDNYVVKSKKVIHTIPSIP